MWSHISSCGDQSGKTRCCIHCHLAMTSHLFIAVTGHSSHTHTCSCISEKTQQAKTLVKHLALGLPLALCVNSLFCKLLCMSVLSFQAVGSHGGGNINASLCNSIFRVNNKAGSVTFFFLPASVLTSALRGQSNKTPATSYQHHHPSGMSPFLTCWHFYKGCDSF